MTAEAVIFYLLAGLTIGSAAVVVLARSLIYNAFALLFTFVGVAGLYLLLGADFIAATQLLIYVGGILVLLLFGVMLTHKIYDLDLRSEATQFLPGAIIAAGLFAILAWPFGWPWRLKGLAFRMEWAAGSERALEATTARIGKAFLGEYLLPFEAASILLLVAMIGAAMLVRRRRDA